jgi:hypothetical protein
MYGDGSTATSELATTTGIRISQTGASSNNYNVTQIMDYSATDKHKTVLDRWNRPSAFVFATAGRWADNTAVNTVRLVPTGTFSVGSTFSLYGVIA